ncbi:MAG: ferredoxin [Candidatus Paceibacterota bacterium]|jgi:ferredoxin|nr:ferredoxin [Candidatus Paceibacterota bacterium]MDD3548450.1 ferredoxin [Candidatus Paceibacterota bacterium]MDD4999229.1 ferredoxin [Candidatus Paceibacterota bacterium]MDD5545492.1 ferredoxin [Candidatus Paceibacterota bacterium]
MLQVPKKNVKRNGFLTFMEIKVDKKKCLGCGLCISLCPEVFELQDGKSQIKAKVDLKKNKNCIEEAKENCPAKAIIVKEK